MFLEIAPEAMVALGLAVMLVWRFWRNPPKTPIPDLSPLNWRDLLDDRIAVLSCLSAEQRALYHQRVEAFLKTKRFIGCGGLEVTDEMKALVAGLACLLILRADARVFPELRSVLIYPGPFLVPVEEPDELGLVPDEPEERVGESWDRERVILSWPDVEAALDGDEVNIVAHEFAHQLDDESRAGEGAPALADYSRWSEVMKTEFERLQRLRRPKVLDPYGAESPAEFFGVVTEAFFQRGPELAQHHPALYALLRDYYGFDTSAVSAANGEP
jgi:Mlc titration factor MtfA (ptsG expression regulator)